MYVSRSQHGMGGRITLDEVRSQFVGSFQFEMKVKYAILVGILCFIAFPGRARSETKFSLAEGKGTKKQEGKKQIPTFVGSDGIVRKVSPAAILEEMKRCLPLGLPIPIQTAWPQLPPHLEDLQEANEYKNELPAKYGEDPVDMQKVREDGEEKKRVSRSNDKLGENGVDATNDRSMNVKLEGPMKETSIFPPKDLNQNKMADVLNDMLSRQIRRQNLTAEYIDDFSVRPRVHKAKIEDYEDYDYVDPEEPKAAKAKTLRDSYHSTPFQTKRQRKPKRRNKYRNSQRNTAERRHMNKLRKKSDYDYDYEESDENAGAHQHRRAQQIDSAKDHSLPNDPIQSDELEKQIEFNDILEKSLNSNGIPERIENIDKFIKKSGRFKMRVGENMDVLEGYQKMLAVVMKLNTTLIRLLNKFSTMFQKTSPETLSDSGRQNDEGKSNDDGKSAVIWDFMDLLMEQRRGARKKRENGPYVPGHSKTEGGDAVLDGHQTVDVSSPSSGTNMDLLSWLLKWYLNSTSKQ